MKRMIWILPLLALVACDGKRGDGSKVLAKIGGTSYSHNDFEFLVKALPPDRQDEIHRDSEARRKQFNAMLKQKLQAMAALKSNYGKDPALQSREVLLDKRIIAQYHYQVHLGENLGRSYKELEDFYKANISKFSDDSGHARPFEEVRTRVADSLTLSKAPIDSFYKQNGHRYLQKAFCYVSVIQPANKKTADEAAKAISGGMSFGDAAKKYSTLRNKDNQGKVGRLVQGETLWELGTKLNLDSLFFDTTTKLPDGVASKPILRDSQYIVVKADSCKAETIPPLATVASQVRADYLAGFKSQLSDNSLANLKVKYNVKAGSSESDPSDADVKAYYESHKDNYVSPETYEVYHIESKNKDQLVKRVKAVKDLDGFKKLAGQFSENPYTKPTQGFIGFIKRDHCLPDGIGMIPSLFPALDSLSSGLVSTPYQNPDTKKWHLFWLTQKNPKQAKPLDRVLAFVKKDFKAEKTASIKPEDTLVTYAKGKVIREKDVLFLREEIPAHLQERYTRETLVDFLLTWDLVALESESNGLSDDLNLRARREENRITYWAQIYQDSDVVKTGGLDSATLKKTFLNNRAYFTKDTAETDYARFARDIAAFLTIEPAEFDLEYHVNPERYTRDTVLLSLSDARYELFQNLRSMAYARAEDRMLERLEREFQVVILDPTLLPPKIENAAEVYKQAQDLHYDRKLDKALDLYLRLRDQFPKMESLQDSICFGTAQIYIEQERYQQALAEYRRLSYLYPKSANNYKAMFMVGFIQAEHLKNDSAAVRAFEKMLAVYPASDLSDDADWMIRNIRSGGKLMPVLEGDSGYVAPDSVKAVTKPVAKPAVK